MVYFTGSVLVPHTLSQLHMHVTNEPLSQSLREGLTYISSLICSNQASQNKSQNRVLGLILLAMLVQDKSIVICGIDSKL